MNYKKVCGEDINMKIFSYSKSELNYDIKNHILNYFNINEKTKDIDKIYFETGLWK